MAVLTSKALHEQLSVIMDALTKAVVVEICELVDEGYAVLQMEISRSHKENEDLKKKLHLIESIVLRGSSGNTAAVEAEVAPAAQGSLETEAPQQRQGNGGDAASFSEGDGTDALTVQQELPEVVLIKDEDSDSSDVFEEEHRAPADGGTAAARETVTTTASSRRLRRNWTNTDEAERTETLRNSQLSAGTQKKSVTIYSLDSPRSEPGGSGQIGSDGMEAGDSGGSYSSQMDPDVHLVQECSLVSPSGSRQNYFGNVTESPLNRTEMDLSLTWTKQSKGVLPLAQFQQSEDVENDAFGLKLVSVSGSTSTDCQMSESSSSTFEYEDPDIMNSIYRDQSLQPRIRGKQPSRKVQEKRFVCSMCSKTYATSQNLEVHMRIHTGERPFSCNQCGKKFTQSAHLKSHLSVHSGERPYSCMFCSRSFIVRYSLKLHMKKCHQIPPI